MVASCYLLYSVSKKKYTYPLGQPGELAHEVMIGQPGWSTHQRKDDMPCL
jgi:hypothetical protein